MFETLEGRSMLSVTSTAPPFPGGTFLLPDPLTLDINFSDPVDTASVQRTDLQLSGNPRRPSAAFPFCPATKRFSSRSLMSWKAA